MPNWRQNLLTAGESLETHRRRDVQQKTVGSDPGSRKPARHFDSISEAITNIRNGIDGFMTDSSSFADYEDHRILLEDDKKDYKLFLKDEESTYVESGQRRNYLEEFLTNENRRNDSSDKKEYKHGSFPEDEERRNYLEEFLSSENHRSFLGDEELIHRIKKNEELKVDRVSKGVFYVSAKSEYDSSRLSSSTCDSFDNFEPFSDTCCCDPLSEGLCSRSPEILDSPDADGDRVSNKSLDGLDLALFEPASSKSGSGGREANAFVGILHLLAGDEDVGVNGCPRDWQPHFCVLLQDRATLAAYRSEDMAVGSSLPRVRVDVEGRRVRGGGPLRCWAAPSIAEEVHMHGEGEGEGEDVQPDAASLQDFPALGELKCLSLPHDFRPPNGGTWEKWKNSTATDTSYEKACRRGSGGNTPTPNTTPLGPQGGSPSRLAAFFFSKRSLRASPLKRARSAAKLAPRQTLRSSRSHESLLSQPAACADAIRGGSVRVLHASLAGRPHCFQLLVPGPPPLTRYYSCASTLERDAWINCLRASLHPEGGNNVRRTERSLRLYLLEAKGLPAKKKYYCELMLDATLYARTSSKLKSELCFWGEVFEFSGLPHVNVITIDVYREPDRKPRKRDKRCLVGSVKIPVHELSGRHHSERWHRLIGSDGSEILGEAGTPVTLRVKCRHQSLEVLPLHCYQPLLSFLKDNYTRLLEYLEPVISVKSKEEVANALVGAVRGAGGAAAAARLLASAAALEVRRAPHAALAFRANSLATKATEAYMKMLGETYLQETLWDCVSSAMQGGGAWEVDPARGAGNGAALRRQRARLKAAVSRAWKSVMASAHKFPPDLRLCFAAFREKLRQMQREELADHLVSASVFLRFLCPAILSPSLFGITHEYPDERAARNLTLVAKTLQTLANFTRFQGKEAFMEFLNDFLEEEAPNMRIFLNDISTLPPGSEQNLQEEWGANMGSGATFLDLGKQLSHLHLLLADCVPRLPANALQELEPLSSIIENLTDELKKQVGSQLDLTIHSPTMHDNIFKFNDPTYSPDPVLAHSSPLLNRSAIQINTLSSSGSSQQEDSGSSKYNTALMQQARKSPSLGLRAATLPRNNYNQTIQNNPERYSSQYNNKEHCINLKVVQIGFHDPKNVSTSSLKINGSSNNVNSPRNVSARNAFLNNDYAGSRDRLYNQGNQMPANLEDLSDLLKYADDQEAERHEDNNPKNIVPQTTINITSGHSHIHNGGSNVSISGLSNVASSGYQSFATYSQSSSPVESYNGQQINQNCCEGSPAHQIRGQNKITLKNNLNKNSQRYEYERQKFGIQNFTRDNGNNSPRPVTAAPLTFTNPVYHIDDERSQFNARDVKRNVSTSSSSSIEGEDDTTDNGEEFANYNRNQKQPRRNQNQKDVIRHSKSNLECHKRPLTKTRSTSDAQKPTEPTPPVRRGMNARVRSNYTTNSPTHNVIHFGQDLDQSFNNNNELEDRLGPTRPDSNVEETNKEMYRLQMSRSQKAITNLENSYSNSNLPRLMKTNNVDAYNSNLTDPQMEIIVDKNSIKNMEFGNGLRITENGYPLERNYSKTNISSSRLNEDLMQNYPPERNYSKTDLNQGYPIERNYSKNNLPSARINDDEAKERQELERAVRRLSLEGVGGDSSSEQEDGSYHTAGRRRLPKNHRTIHQYEREIERLKSSVDMLRKKLETVEIHEEPSSRGSDLADSKMKGIIDRLLGVEEELRREQRAMAAALNIKQRVIERQGQRLAALGAANARLLSALHHLQPNLTRSKEDQPQLQNPDVILQSEQLLNNLQSDLQPLYQETGYSNAKNNNQFYPYQVYKKTVVSLPSDAENFNYIHEDAQRSGDEAHQAVVSTQPSVYYGSP